MPITSSAKKALRKDKRRTIVNKKIKAGFKEAVKKARSKPTPKTLALASQALDWAAKKKVIHQNKASRLKSRLAKLIKITKPKSKAK